MAGKSPLKASEEQRQELKALSASRDRGEADRARAVLLTLGGWTSRRIAAAFAVREDTVRLWRSDFMRGGIAKKVAMMGALDWRQRKLVVSTSGTKRSADFIALLATLDQLYGPKPGVRTKPVVIVLDNGPIHVSKATLAALAARAHWLIVEWLPKYAPELNDIEVVWHDLKAFNLAHKTFTDVDTLDAAIHTAVADLNAERNRDLLGEQRISA